MFINLKRLLIKRNKQKGKKIIVFTNGCFDILHVGHIKHLKEMKKLGDILIIGLNSDDSIKRIKGGCRPLNNQRDRAFALSELKSVDYVVLFKEDAPENIIAKIMPDILVKGSDYSNKYIAGKKIVIENGGRVVLLPYDKKYSDTKLIKKIKKEC